MKHAVLMLAVPAFLVAGCAKIDQTMPQSIALSIDPATAQCDAYQHGDVVGRYEPSQRTITVPRSPGATEILCSAPGFKDKRVAIVPSPLGRFSALLADLGTVDGEYPTTVQITMEPADRQGQPI